MNKGSKVGHSEGIPGQHCSIRKDILLLELAGRLAQSCSWLPLIPYGENSSAMMPEESKDAERERETES